MLFDNSCFTTGSLYLCDCRFREGVGLHLYGGGDFTVAKHFHQFTLGGDTGGDEGVHVEFLEAELFAEGLDGGDVNSLEFYAGRILEAELGKTALDGQLTTFETYFVLVTGTGLCTFGTTGGGATFTGTLAAANALGVMGCALCGLQIFKFHLLILLSQLLHKKPDVQLLQACRG